VLAPGTVQFIFDDIGGKGATVALWIDGQRTGGSIVHRIHTQDDRRIESSYPRTNFAPDAYALVHAGARIEVRGEPQELSAAITALRRDDPSDSGTAFSLFGPYARIPVESGRRLLVLDAAWEEQEPDHGGVVFREEVRFVFPVNVIGSESAPSLNPVPTGPILVTFDTSEEGKIPTAFATFGGRPYMAVMEGYRFTIDGEVFESSWQYRNAAMVGRATIVVRPGAVIRFEGTQDRVLAAWGGNPLAPASSLSVHGVAGETAVLRFRGEWGPDSFVEAELFFEIQEA
jgi:hypothetical protein